MDGGADPPRIDRPILTEIRDRIASAPQFDRASIRDAEGQVRLVIDVDDAIDPPAVEHRQLDVRWYTNDDFRIHYREAWPDRTWSMRWDRHPSTHNDRDHFHPPPDAETPGLDRTWPEDYRDVLALVVGAVHDRTRTLWDEHGTDQ